jgi:hypothetical protein
MRMKRFQRLLIVLSVVFIAIWVYRYAKDDTIEFPFIEVPYAPSSSRFLVFTNVCDETTKCQRKTKKYGGLADRLKAISFGYLWALMTNRTFLIYVKEPCPLQYYLNSKTAYQNLSAVLQTIYTGERAFANIEIANIGIYGPEVNDDGYHRSNSVLHKLLKYKNDSDVILYKGEFFYQDAFLTIPNHIGRLRQLGLDPLSIRTNGLMKFVYESLFELSPKLHAKYNEFMRYAKPSRDSYLICAQVRLGDDVLVDSKSIKQNHSSRIFEFIKRYFTQYLGRSKIFVTTDSASVEQEARSFFGERDVAITTGDIAHVDIDKKLDAECERYEKTFLDFHILKDCDMGVVSMSGFGRLGVYRSENVKNIYVYHHRKDFVEDKIKHFGEYGGFLKIDDEFLRSNVEAFF